MPLVAVEIKELGKCVTTMCNSGDIVWESWRSINVPIETSFHADPTTTCHYVDIWRPADLSTFSPGPRLIAFGSCHQHHHRRQTLFIFVLEIFGQYVIKCIKWIQSLWMCCYLLLYSSSIYLVPTLDQAKSHWRRILSALCVHNVLSRKVLILSDFALTTWNSTQSIYTLWILLVWTLLVKYLFGRDESTC